MALVQLYAVEIPFLCSNASQRVVMASFFSDSQITRPALKIAASQATILVGGNAISTASTWQSSGTSTGPGAYSLVLTQSECSAQGVPGYVTLYTSTATIGPNLMTIRFPRVDSYDTMRMGLLALPNAAPAAAGGLPTFGTGAGQLNLSGGSVGLVPAVMSGVSVEVKTGGIQSASIGGGTYSSVTIQGLSNYANISNVTLAAGTHSGATVQGVSRLNSAVTLNADTHSGATIQGLTRALNLSANGDKTGYGLADGAITSAKFGAGAIDAVALATDAGQEIADRVLTRNVGGGSDTGRTVKFALAPLVNKVSIEGSTITVFDTDDSTSLWTGTVTTGTDPISGVDPLGP